MRSPSYDVTGPVSRSLAVSPYALALAAASVHTGRTIDDAAARPLVPLAFMAMHIGWGVGFWEGLVHEFRTSGRR